MHKCHLLAAALVAPLLLHAAESGKPKISVADLRIAAGLDQPPAASPAASPECAPKASPSPARIDLNMPKAEALLRRFEGTWQGSLRQDYRNSATGQIQALPASEIQCVAKLVKYATGCRLSITETIQDAQKKQPPKTETYAILASGDTIVLEPDSNGPVRTLTSTISVADDETLSCAATLAPKGTNEATHKAAFTFGIKHEAGGAVWNFTTTLVPIAMPMTELRFRATLQKIN